MSTTVRPAPWLPLLAGAGALLLAALILLPGRGTKGIVTHGSPARPLPAGVALDFTDLRLSLVPGEGTPLPVASRSAAPSRLVRFDLNLESKRAEGFPLTGLSAGVLDGRGAALPAMFEAPGAFLDTGEARLVPMRANVPAAWDACVLHVEYVTREKGRVEAFLALPSPPPPPPRP